MLFVFTIFLLGCFFAGCAGGGRYIKEPSAAPEIGIFAASDDLHVTLNCLIYANGPGSWVKDAPWHEYIVSVKTPPDKSLTIFKMALVDPTGVERMSGAHPAQLKQASESLLKMYKSQGTLGAAAAGGMAASFLTAIPLLGPAFNIAGMGLQKSGRYADAKDQEEIAAEFQRRQLPFPLSLSANANVRGSFFFPVIPNPKALVIDYRVGKEMETKTLKMLLEKAK
jgi:hypothetical protein